MSSSSSPPQETELKFLILQDAHAVLRAHPAFAGVEPGERLYRTTYFDALDYPLGAAGISLRLRQSPGTATFQTLKKTSPTASFGQRDEWECAVDGDAPDLSLFDGLELGPALGEPLHGKLTPIFTVNVRRTAWLISVEGTTQIEAVIDEGEVRADDKAETLREIELELKSGPVAPMYRLALDLASKMSLALGTESKSDRGYRLLTGESRKPAHAAYRSLDKDIGLEDGFREIMAGGLTQLVANMPAAAAGADEAIHQMRIALRRLRSYLVLFSVCIDPLTAARFNDVLRRLGAVLGTARDWDVFVGQTLPGMKEAGVASDDAFDSAAAKRRASAHDAVATLMKDPLLTGLVIGLGGWIEDRPLDRIRGNAGRLIDHAPDLLDRLTRKVAKRGRHIDALEGAPLHDLRKALKKLRYCVDALSPLYRRKDVEAYSKALKQLQESLGTINDTAVTPRLVAELAEDIGKTTTAEALARVARHHRKEALRHLRDHWERYQKATPFWH